MKRKRNYKAESERHKKRGSKTRPGRSKPRKLPKTKKNSIAQKKHRKPSAVRIQVALSQLREGKTLAESARSAGITPDQFRYFIKTKGLARKQGQRWVLRKRWPREMRFFSNGKAVKAVLPYYKTSALVGSYLSAVRQFLETNDASHLEPFIGVSVTDKAKKTYPLETRPNILYRLNTGTEAFEQIYRIVI
jgi:hypothetical protein